MLSLFPSLLSYERLAPFLLRLVLGIILIYWSYACLRTSCAKKLKTIAVIEGISGILLIIGLWTQAAALVVVIDMLVRLAGRIKRRAFLTNGVNYYLIMLVIALSLLVTGAGAFALDLPL